METAEGGRCEVNGEKIKQARRIKVLEGEEREEDEEKMRMRRLG